MGFFKSIGKKIVSAVKTVVSAVKTVASSAKAAIIDDIKNPEVQSNKISVKSIDVIEKFVFDVEDRATEDESTGKIELTPHLTLTKRAHIRLHITRTAKCIGMKDRKATLDAIFKPGFVTDGASVPESFRNILPAYIAKDDEIAHKYNAAAFIHDGLYACEGVIEERNIPSSEENKNWHTLTRSECDDILRGTWRSSGFVEHRFVASIADLAVGIAAGGPDHWGHRDENMELFSATIQYE